MRKSPIIPLLGASALAIGLAVAAPSTATAESADTPTTSAGQLKAMQRDLGLGQTEAKQLIQEQKDARSLEKELRSTLGRDFGGAVFDTESGELTVSVTDASATDTVRESGAEPRVVEYGEKALNDVVADLNEGVPESAEGVTGWYPDLTEDTVVMTVRKGETTTAKDLVTDAGVDTDAVRIKETGDTPRTYANIVGGDPYYIGGGGRCSIGFSVQQGFVTAGHCGSQGQSARGANGGTGTFLGSIFPGRDMAYVGNTSNWTPTPNVRGSNQQVAGSQEASVGSSICRSGSTTGWHCGTVEAKNQTVRYPQGTVNGLTQTTVCAEPGDSGGSYITGAQAQGVTSGGSGNCSSGGTTFYQPVNPILSQWNLTLVTA